MRTRHGCSVVLGLVVAIGLPVLASGCAPATRTPVVRRPPAQPPTARRVAPLVRPRPLPASLPRRGNILDRRGRVLAAHAVRYNVYAVPRDVEAAGWETLRTTLGLPRDWSRRQRKRLAGLAAPVRGRAVLVLPGLTPKRWRSAREKLRRIRGIWVRPVLSRSYPLGNVASHVLGHLGEVSADELKRGYRVRDRVGRFGVERSYERTLRGIFHGRGRPPTAGRRVVLTLDADFQRRVEKALAAHTMASAVVVEVKTGRILALASRPALNLRRLAESLSPAELNKLVGQRNKPFWDRSVMAAMNPGGTVSVLTALSALESKRPRVRRRIRCRGGVTQGKVRFRCPARHGAVTVQRALVRGCRSYFYHAARRLGTDRLSRLALAFGLGRKTGLGLNDEVSGNVPTVSRLQRAVSNPRDAAHAMNAAIGQGRMTVTPLQLALAYAAIANGGRLYHPQLVLRTERPDGTPFRRFKPRLRRRVKVSSRSLGVVRRALRWAVSQPHGIAGRARVTGTDVAGLTGSGQGGAFGYHRPGAATHAWFAGYAPAKAPEIAVVVLVQGGGSGDRVAAPTAAKIIAAYVRHKSGKPLIASTRRQ